jgi:cytochrome c556
MARVQYYLCGCLAILIGLALTPASLQAQEEGAFIQYRQKVMAANSANMGAINDIVKNKLPYQSHITAHAQDIQRMSMLISDAFKKDITAGKTDAKPEIWKEWNKFTAAADTMGREAAELVKVSQGGNLEAISTQAKKLSDTCGDCHKPYRKPKEESYKNKP